MLLALLLAAPAEAKDLRSKLGVGVHQQFVDVTAFSARFTLPGGKPTTLAAVEALAGVDLTASVDPTFYVGGRFLYTVVAEDNLNFYLGVGAGYASTTGVGAGRVEPVAGVEFFAFGLENLGWSVEWGVRADLGTTWKVKTAPNLAVHYYF